MARLYDRLRAYSESDYYGFHMPGHKRRRTLTGAELPYELDITEIEGFDDLHHAEGVLKEAQERAARVFGAEESHYLVNGSTVGLLSGILGSTRRGDRILVARNCHKSVYHALELGGLVPRYVYPRFESKLGISGEICPEDVERALSEEPGIRTVVIVSPSYDGVVSDVARLAQIAHTHGAALLVDEAHGAHFGMHPYFPQRANALGADIVVNSLHKTLPSLTQSSLLHINGDRADRERIRKYLDMLQSSSPSYLLMASLDACVDWLEREGSEQFARYADRLRHTRQQLTGLRHLRLLETAHYDRSKLAISTLGTPWSGKQLYDRLLQDAHLQLEMAAGTYALALTSVADTQEGLDRLRDALYKLDTECTHTPAAVSAMLFEEKPNPTPEYAQEPDTLDAYRENSHKESTSAENTPEHPGKQDPIQLDTALPHQKQIYSPAEMDDLKFKAQARTVPWEESIGCVSLEYTYLYPPGIPLIVPGEQIRTETIRLIQQYEKYGFQIEGNHTPSHICVIPYVM